MKKEYPIKMPGGQSIQVVVYTTLRERYTLHPSDKRHVDIFTYNCSKAFGEIRRMLISRRFKIDRCSLEKYLITRSKKIRKHLIIRIRCNFITSSGRKVMVKLIPEYKSGNMLSRCFASWKSCCLQDSYYGNTAMRHVLWIANSISNNINFHAEFCLPIKSTDSTRYIPIKLF